MNTKYQITDLIQETVKAHLRENDTVIDATLGKGRDSLFLLEHVPDGFLYGFDIQTEALQASEKLLSSSGFANYRLIRDSHENISKYLSCEIGCAMFNLGYLPGSLHEIHTNENSSIQAIQQCLQLLRKDGIISVCCYPGTEKGKRETEAILEYLRSLDTARFLVIVCSYHNRPKDPPLPVFIIRIK